MLRGDIRIVDLGPGLPGDATKTRPVVIVSNNGANAMAARLGCGALTVVPMTSNVDTVYPFQAWVSGDASGLEQASKAQAELVRSVSVDRIGELVGHVVAPRCSRSTTPYGHTSSSSQRKWHPISWPAA
jgi:mRNA interferase MazF